MRYAPRLRQTAGFRCRLFLVLPAIDYITGSSCKLLYNLTEISLWFLSFHCLPFPYCNTMKNGTVSDKLRMQERKLNIPEQEITSEKKTIREIHTGDKFSNKQENNIENRQTVNQENKQVSNPADSG
jgi:hypothetical protein